MEKFTSFEFDPSFNRLLNDISFNAPSDDVHPPVDPKDPYKPVYSGYIQRNVTAEDGTEYSYLAYVPARYPSYHDSIFIVIPSGRDPKEFMEEYGWTEAAEEKNAAVIAIYQQSCPWAEWDINDALLYIRRVMIHTNRRDRFSNNECGYGFVGYGDAAYATAAYAMLYSSMIVGTVLYGNTKLSDELFDKIASLPSDGDHAVLKTDVPLSAWIIDDNEKLVKYFQHANNTADEKLRNDIAKIYREKQNPRIGIMNERSVNEVWWSTADDIKAISKKELSLRMLNFTNSRRRYHGVANRTIRPNQTPEEIGMEKREIVIDGFHRHYHLFVPSAYKKDPSKKLPLVFAIHGACCNGMHFACNTEMHRVGEARGFFVVYPTAYPRTTGSLAPMPLWEGMADFNDGVDDVKYFRSIIKELEAEFPIDSERIFSFGHSNGSMMTQNLMRKAPELFAGFAPIGATDGDMQLEPAPALPHDLVCPVWYIKGDMDIGCAASLDDNMPNMVMVRHLCKNAGADYNKRRQYSCGVFDHYLWYSEEDHIPYVRFTAVNNMTHAISPDMSWMAWDEFFCHLRRKADGSIEYMG